MLENDAIDIIKSAILFEYKGKAFYMASAKGTENVTIRKLFQTLADEEEMHINMLQEQYLNLRNEGKLKPADLDEKPVDFGPDIITVKVKEEISGAGYEAAAISAAMALEEKAIQFYSESADKSQDPIAKEIYQWLANWEKNHLAFLSDIDKELTESVWYDNNFWPEI
ncbi:ferritin family protein [bacterium]|nr:ferritin family protein [bacterium]